MEAGIGAAPPSVGEGGVVAQAAAVRPGDESWAAVIGADAGLVEQFGAARHDELLELAFEFVGLGLEREGAAGDGAERDDGRAVLEPSATAACAAARSGDELVGRRARAAGGAAPRGR